MMSINLNLNAMGICQTYHLNLLFLKMSTFSVTLKMADCFSIQSNVALNESIFNQALEQNTENTTLRGIHRNL